jgi:predicted DNA-binding transcriptional regulator AlpA
MADQQPIYLRATDVRDRYGRVSDMWLYRRVHDPEGDFPKPVYIAGRRFWRLADLIAWEDRRHAQKPRTTCAQ